MTDAIQELGARAGILHQRISSRDRASLVRLRALPRFRRLPEEELAALADTIRRGDCLAVMAAEIGFPSWPLARRVLEGAESPADFGTLLWSSKCAVHLNRWFARYDEAAEAREACSGYLLAYRKNFVIVDRHYIETLGLDPADPDWEALGFDWVRPRDAAARARLYARLVAALPREAA